MIRLFIREKNNILKNLEIYEQKEKAKQQKSKILGQKQANRKRSKKERTRMYHF